MVMKCCKPLLTAMLCAVVTACSSFSAGNLFSHYTLQNSSVRQAVSAGDYESASSDLSDYIAGDILDNMEKGRVTFLNQSYLESQSFFEASEVAIRSQQDQATISISESANSIGSLAVNDNLSTYYPADYEVGFLHLYLALNYLVANDLEGALVEIRKANQVQERAKKARESDLLAAEKEIKKGGLSPNLGSVLSQYPDAGSQLQAVQNGYLLFLSALLYETAGELNSAYVDYKRALAVMPTNSEIIQGTIRLATALGMKEDLVKLNEAYQGVQTALPEGKSRVIIIEERGIVSAKQGWKFSLPIYSHGDWAYYNLSLPYYEKQVSPSFAKLMINNRSISSSKLVDVNLMAQQDLTERIPTILFRQALRVVAKEQIRREATKGDEVGNLLVNVWNVLTEQPDTRSWQTLPAKVHSSSEIVKPGEQTINYGGQQYRINVEQGRTVLLWISRQGSNATVWHKQLGSLE